jgi:hypothetical protein
MLSKDSQLDTVLVGNKLAAAVTSSSAIAVNRLREPEQIRVPASAVFFHLFNKRFGVQKVTFGEFLVSRSPRFVVKKARLKPVLYTTILIL